MIGGKSVEQNRIEKPLETTLPPIIIGIAPLFINSEFQKPSIFCELILRSFHSCDSFGISPLLRLKRQIRMSIVPSIFGGRSSVYDPFSFDIWDPFSSLISDFGPSRQLAQDASAVANTRIDWKETPEAHLFKADLPGLKKEEVKVEVEEGRILKISGERSKEEEQKTDKWHRVERSHGRFQRRFRLPENVKVDELRASLENGLLTVTVPKQPEPKPEVKSIEIGGSG